MAEMGKTIGVVAGFVGVVVVGWLFIRKANTPTLEIYNLTEGEVSVDVGGKAFKIESHNYKSVEKVEPGTTIEAKDAKGASLEKVQIGDDRDAAHYVYNVNASNQTPQEKLVLADWSGMYECEKTQKPMASELVTVKQDLTSKSLTAVHGRLLLNARSDLPTKALDCDLAILRLEIIPQQSLEPIDWITKMTLPEVARQLKGMMRR